MKCCINGGNFIRLLLELFKFEIQKCGQILCAHKPYFLMPGHIFHCFISSYFSFDVDKRFEELMFINSPIYIHVSAAHIHRCYNYGMYFSYLTIQSQLLTKAQLCSMCDKIKVFKESICLDLYLITVLTKVIAIVFVFENFSICNCI